MKEYKGDIKGFPEEVVEWMLDQQEEQGNKRDIKVFENEKCACFENKGFEWSRTEWGHTFCVNVIIDKKFDVFFERMKNVYPKVMLVRNYDFDQWIPRVVFMEKNHQFISWLLAETIKESEHEVSTRAWNYAKELEPEKVKITKQQIADKFNVDVNLIEIL